MGVLARILMFPNAQKKLEAFSKLDELVGKEPGYEYSNIHLYNETYKLNVSIKLLLKVTKQGRLPSMQYISDIYILTLDVPVEHKSLEGKFDVKEAREVHLAHYTEAQLEKIAIMLTERGSRTLSYALQALRKIGFNPLESIIELPTGQKAVDILHEIGNIGWVYIDEIRDTHLRGAGLYGRSLQYSEILEDLTTRGGQITAAIVEHPQRDIKMIISQRGSIYSQQNLDIITLARVIKDVLYVMIKHNLVRLRSVY